MVFVWDKIDQGWRQIDDIIHNSVENLKTIHMILDLDLSAITQREQQDILTSG